MIYVGAENYKQFSEFFVSPFFFFSFNTFSPTLSVSDALGRLCSDRKPAAFFLPGSVLLDVSGGRTTLQDGCLGLQHQL